MGARPPEPSEDERAPEWAGSSQRADEETGAAARVASARRAVVFAEGRLVCQALAAALRSTGVASEVRLAEATPDVARLCLDAPPHLVLLAAGPGEASMPLALVRLLHRAVPDTATVVATVEAGPELLRAFHAAGASFALPLDASVAELARGCHHALGNPEGTRWASWLAAHAGYDRPKRLPASIPGPHLTRRQREILVLLCRGLDNASIARELGIREKTVRNQVTALQGTLGTHRRTETVVVALATGLVELDPVGRAVPGPDGRVR